MDLDLEAILPGPWNPREDFDEAALEELAGTIRSVGLLQPIVVRPMPAKLGHYQIIAGERRFRAAKLAGEKRIAARVVNLADDAQVRQVAILENLQREDLNPIEEARGFAALLEANGKGGAPVTQEELARRLGCSQAHIANRLRLLRLPAEWQEKVTSGTLPATHARAVVPYAKHSQILKEIEKEIGRGPVPNIECFEEETLAYAVDRMTRPVEGNHFDYKLGLSVPVFKPTPEQEAELAIVEFPGGRRSKKPKRRATNVKLWDKLQAAHAKAWLKEYPAGQRGGKTKAKAKANGKPEPLSPEEERRRAKERARRLAAALWEFKVDWLRMLVAGRLRTVEVRPAALLRILCYFAVYRDAVGRGSPREALAAAVRAVAGRGTSRDKIYPALCGLNDAQSAAAIAELLAGWFWSDPGGPCIAMEGASVVETADLLEIDLARQWADHRAGPLTRRYLELHDRESLARLAAAWKVGVVGADGKAKIVRLLMEREKLPFPEEIEKAGPPKPR